MPATKVRDVMAQDPVTLPADTALSEAESEAAVEMRDGDIGSVIVADGSGVRGIVTDRDIVVRAVAEHAVPSDMTIGEICSGDPVTLSLDDDVEPAIELMRTHAVRRLPVVQDGAAVGVLSIGNLALARDEQSALADISAAEPDS